MGDLRIGFLSTYSGRWPRELPKQRARFYGEWLSNQFSDMVIIREEEPVGSKEHLKQTVTRLKMEQTDLVIMVYGAFTGDDTAAYIAQELKVPILLWAPYELPFEKNDRLYANALCAMTMNAASLKRLGACYHTVYGGIEDERAVKKVTDLVKAYDVIKTLKNVQLGLLGYRPTAFYNCTFDEALIRKTFGISIEETDLKAVFDYMDQVEDSVWTGDGKHMSETYDTSMLPEGHLENHSKLYAALKRVMTEQGYDFATIKCWPEMGNLHTTPCAVLGRLADEEFHIGCEGDVDAEITQLIQVLLTEQPTFIADLINLDERENTITFWHCGNCAPSLMNPDYEPVLANHPLAGQGTAFWAPLRQGDVTIARFCNLGGSYKLFLLRGCAVDKDRYTRGAMVNVKAEKPVREITELIIEEGIAHHYSIVWKDVADQMKQICGLLNIPVIEV